MRPCTHHDGALCGATPTRRYLPGARCRAHTPAALAGRQEPGTTATPWQPRWASPLPVLHDTRGRADARAALERHHDDEGGDD